MYEPLRQASRQVHFIYYFTRPCTTVYYSTRPCTTIYYHRTTYIQIYGDALQVKRHLCIYQEHDTYIKYIVTVDIRKTSKLLVICSLSCTWIMITQIIYDIKDRIILIIFLLQDLLFLLSIYFCPPTAPQQSSEAHHTQ
jgi:hypothetical protein